MKKHNYGETIFLVQKNNTEYNYFSIYL
jgi:hypothetical protein